MVVTICGSRNIQAKRVTECVKEGGGRGRGAPASVQLRLAKHKRNQKIGIFKDLIGNSHAIFPYASLMQKIGMRRVAWHGPKGLNWGEEVRVNVNECTTYTCI
jgi:hypothetical protein